MNLSWLFGPTMEQRHLLYVYLSVWLIQGGYFLSLAIKWARTPTRDSHSPSSGNTARTQQ
jgi:hypothetical protein